MERGPSNKCTIRVRLTPRASRDAVIGYRVSDQALILRVAAPPVDGAANQSCIALVATALRVPRSQVKLTGGDKSREKSFTIDGLSERERDLRLAELPIIEEAS